MPFKANISRLKLLLSSYTICDEIQDISLKSPGKEILDFHPANFILITCAF